MRGVWSGASTPSQRVIAWACGPVSAVGAGHALRDLLRGEGVVDGEQAGRTGVGQPVGAAVADPAHDELGPVDDGGHERARRRVAGAGAGVRDDGLVGGVGGGHQSLGAHGDPGGDGAAPRRARRRPARRARPGPQPGSRRRSRSTTRPRRRRPARRARRARTRRPARRHPRCAVWRTPRSQTAATQGAGCSVKWLRARGRRGAALRAVPVVGDLAAALVAGPRGGRHLGCRPRGAAARPGCAAGGAAAGRGRHRTPRRTARPPRPRCGTTGQSSGSPGGTARASPRHPPPADSSSQRPAAHRVRPVDEAAPAPRGSRRGRRGRGRRPRARRAGRARPRGARR